MKNEKSVFESGDEFRCVEFYDVDPDESGVEIFLDTKLLGRINGISIPPIDDEEENNEFDKKVIEWIRDNAL